MEAPTKYLGWSCAKWAFSEILGNCNQVGILSPKSIYHCQKDMLSSTWCKAWSPIVGNHSDRYPDWDGDGYAEIAPDDGEWGGEAPARQAGEEPLDSGERGSLHETLTEHLHRQALALRLSPEDMAVLRFLIESLNDDGYLEDSLAQLAATLMDDDDDLEQMQELVHRFTLAHKLYVGGLQPAW